MQNKRGRDVHVDALWLAKRSLEGLRAQKIYVENLEQDIEDKYETATTVTAMYGEHIGHSSEIKQHVGGKLADDNNFQAQKTELQRARRILSRIERAVELLPETERVIITERYIESQPRSWGEVASEVGYEVRNCHYLHNKALRNIAIHLCGLDNVLNMGNRLR